MPITPVKTLVAKARDVIVTLPQDRAEAMVEAGEALFVDIRDIRELDREGRIPGAIHAPRGMLEFWVDPESPYFKPVFETDKTLILFCASAWRSALATRDLQNMGFENVAEMEGGFSQWKARGAAIEKA
ncbi:rhodanese-like domain-containing protein [Shimia sp. FJ5]|uniref:rhodanese-like domain-containing protein n=1 Tax=Shimia sp. FJ5 TaxID=3079054 RepID=UPI0026337DED|nr:rhodanese-like domain-containing protein [Shimia sp. FJ5]MDV4144851.1 rhodanese-like domain-containing protein [Shimia sp. FJ5]